MMKKLGLAVIITMASSGAFAQNSACTGNATETTYNMAAGTNFIATAFDVHCSANTLLRFNQNTSAFWVGSTSTKGKNSFRGTTSGGGVTVFAACNADPCAVGDANAALADAAPTGSN